MGDEMVRVCVGSWRRMRVDGDMTLMMMTTGSLRAKRRVYSDSAEPECHDSSRELSDGSMKLTDGSLFGA